MKYSVNTWGSHPHTNDDCYSGKDFDTAAEARECYNNPAAHFVMCCRSEFIELTGPDVDVFRRDLPPEEDEYDDVGEWIKEIARELGMGLGIAAYNDAMGQGLGR